MDSQGYQKAVNQAAKAITYIIVGVVAFAAVIGFLIGYLA